MKFLALLAGLLAAAAVAGFAFVKSGFYDISATDQHLRLTYRAIQEAMHRSVERRARAIEVPPLDSAALLTRGEALFREHCVQCHGGPGVAPAPFALALRPHATPLARTGRDRPPEYIFWVVKHGIKMTGMPAWEFRFDDDDTWAVVAYVRRLPSISPAQFAASPRPALAIADPEPVGGPDAARGRRAVEQYACIACHEIPGLVGPEARLGPTLHGVGSRLMLAGLLPNSPENLALWVRSPQEVKPGSAMPDLGVTRRDARDIAAYLSTLREY